MDFEMGKSKTSNMPIGDDFLETTRAIFSNMNIGFVIYHVEDPQNAASIRFIYANEEASKYTGTDLSKLIGKLLHEAFPELQKTDIPEIYAEVARTKEARNIGALEYSDENVKQGYFAIKVFPMPNDYIGVAFENITAKKELEGLVKKYTDEIREKNRELEKLLSRIYNEIALPLRIIHAKGENLLGTTKSALSKSEIESIQEMTDKSLDLADLIDELLMMARGQNPV